MPNINLLAWREERRKTRAQSFYVALVSGVIAALGLVGLANLVVQNMIDHQKSRNGYLTNEIVLLDEQIKEIKDLEAEKQRREDRMLVIETLQLSRPEVVHVFDELVQRLPDGVYLTAITQTGRSIKIEGIAQSNTYVAAFMRDLDKSDWFKDPDLTVVENVNKSKKQSGQRGSKFTVTVSQSSPGDEAEDESGDIA